MQIVISISDELYNYMCSEQPYDEHLDKRFDFQIRNSVKKGIALPKGHGRIIDERKITKCEKIGLIIENGNVTRCLSTDAPTIIKADKESK